MPKDREAIATEKSQEQEASAAAADEMLTLEKLTQAQEPEVSAGSASQLSAESPATFARAGRGKKGYERRAVDAFMAHARASFEQEYAEGTPAMNSATVRSVAFPLVKHGYSVPAVDAALGRIEDAFAVRERSDALDTVGAQAWVEQRRGDAQVILDRLSRARGRRFDRVSWMRYGYRVDEVDLVSAKISLFLSDGGALTADQVRTVAFRMQRGGYREAQVDAVLDAVVDVILAVR